MTHTSGLLASLERQWHAFVAALPDLALAFALLFVGWLVAKLVRRLAVRLFRAIRLDVLAERAGIELTRALEPDETQRANPIRAAFTRLAVMDDDGNVSHAVHQYDRFLPEMHGFVSRLSAYECPDRVFVNRGTRPVSITDAGARLLVHAEAAVDAAPRDAGYRMLLGDLYLKNGRFQSAETSSSRPSTSASSTSFRRAGPDFGDTAGDVCRRAPAREQNAVTDFTR